MNGTEFGRYRLIELLGRGGMGEVWRAYDTSTDRVVAVKVLAAALARDEVFEQRFRREAKMAAALNEPHVVPIHNFGEIDGRLFVDMRLIEGTDLQTLLKRGPLDPKRAVMIIEQIAAALSAAHRVGLVHRDVKPSNILVAEFDYAYLIDFGIARAVGEEGLTGTGSMIGTWAYMAPERFGDGQPDARSDTYALACVLHESLTGRQPYPGDSVEQQFAAHMNSAPPQPSITDPRLPAQFDAVIAGGMAKNPDERYPSITDLAAAARAAITVPTTQPRQPYSSHGTPNQPAPRASTRWRPTLIFASVIAVVALVVGSVVGISLIGDGSSKVAEHSAGAPSPVPPMDTEAAQAATSALTFAGTYRADFGSVTRFDGAPRDLDWNMSTWEVQSTCSTPGCVATATRIDGDGYSSTLVFDNVDGRWLAVSEQPDNTCGFVKDSRWEVLSLVPAPDGSLSGDWSAAWTFETCSLKRAVTFTRIGDLDAAVDTADVSQLEPRVVSPAEAFRGQYQNIQTYLSDGTTYEYTLDFSTNCLRDGTRCLSFGTSVEIDIAMMFANDTWRYRWASDDACPDDHEQLARQETTIEYPLPQPLQNPIDRLTGNGRQVTTGDCSSDDSFDDIFIRIGD